METEVTVMLSHEPGDTGGLGKLGDQPCGPLWISDLQNLGGSKTSCEIRTVGLGNSTGQPEPGQNPGLLTERSPTHPPS